MPDWKTFIRRHLAGLNLDAVREAEIAEELAQHAEDRTASFTWMGWARTRRGAWRSKSLPSTKRWRGN